MKLISEGPPSYWGSASLRCTATPSAHHQPPLPNATTGYAERLNEAAERLAAIVRDENADVLLSYDPNGGYGHRDHVKVHEVGRRAAELSGVTLLEATMPRDVVERMVRVIRALRIPFRYDAEIFRTAYSPGSAITHRVNVRRFAKQKQAALAAHQSSVNGTGRLASVMRLLVRLPAPVFGLLAGVEWYVNPATTPVDKTATTIV